jgi:hypothetical protein
MTTHPIIDRDIDFYLASLETEERILRSCRGGRDEQIAAYCCDTAMAVVQALKSYRKALEDAGRIDASN